MSNQQKTEYKLLSDFLVLTKIIPTDLERILLKHKVLKIITPKGEEAISNKDFYILLYSKEVKESAYNGLILSTQRVNDDIQNKSKRIQEKIDDRTEFIEENLNKLILIHQKYTKRIDTINNKNSLPAAYIIFVRAFNLIHIINMNIKLGYLNILILFRPLNESLIMAEYFLSTKDTQKGKVDLEKWFFEDRSPNISDMRNKVEEFSRKHLPIKIYDLFKGLLFRLHDRLSKSVHNSYNDVTILFKPILGSNKIEFMDYEYKTSVKLREIYELVQYLESVLHTSILQFTKCFEIYSELFESDDIIELDTMRKQLENNMKLRYDLI